MESHIQNYHRTQQFRSSFTWLLYWQIHLLVKIYLYPPQSILVAIWGSFAQICTWWQKLELPNSGIFSAEDKQGDSCVPSFQLSCRDDQRMETIGAVSHTVRSSSSGTRGMRLPGWLQTSHLTFLNLMFSFVKQGK